MSWPEDQGVGATALAELDAVDAALAGEPVEDGHEALAALALALRDTRELPSEELARSLDEAAAEHFARPRRRNVRRRAQAVVRHPAFAIAAILLVGVAFVLPLALFAHGSGGSASSPAAGTSAGAAASPNTENTPAEHAPAERQIEHTASLDVGVPPSSMQSTSQRVFTIASAFHGYVQQSNVSSGNAEQAGATFTIRVPSENLSGAIAALAHLGHVRSENETTNDVTEAHAGLERSLGDARAERASLLAQLAHASEPEAVQMLKDKLRAIDAIISRLEGSLHALDGRVQFTNIALSLTPEASAAATAGDLTPGGALHDAGAILDAGLAVIVLAAAALIPVAVIVAAVAFALAALRRRLRESALDAS
jgi:hypothetical protein